MSICFHAHSSLRDVVVFCCPRTHVNCVYYVSTLFINLFSICCLFEYSYIYIYTLFLFIKPYYLCGQHIAAGLGPQGPPQRWRRREDPADARAAEGARHRPRPPRRRPPRWQPARHRCSLCGGRDIHGTEGQPPSQPARASVRSGAASQGVPPRN